MFKNWDGGREGGASICRRDNVKWQIRSIIKNNKLKNHHFKNRPNIERKGTLRQACNRSSKEKSFSLLTDRINNMSHANANNKASTLTHTSHAGELRF